MPMDDATSLVAELLYKLDELEQKVLCHRRDMATEFHRYSQHLLQNVSDNVSAEVGKIIRNSMHKYPAIHPALEQSSPFADESPTDHARNNNTSTTATTTDTTHKRWRGRGSPPPPLPHTSSTRLDSVHRSSHEREREREFQGLFTPCYLPLLDSRDSNLSPPTGAPATPSQPTGTLTSNLVQADQPLSPSGIITRPVPVRQHTGETLSSITSDDSAASKNRRSALRRSSTSSAKTQSPRRVRFEFGGSEVLPTASPRDSPQVAEHSPLANATNLPGSPLDSSAIIDEEDEDTGLLGSSPPLPKKITSTDRLKALARSSNEDTSKWTMVGDLQDMDEDEEALIMGSGRKTSLTTKALDRVNKASVSAPQTNGKHGGRSTSVDTESSADDDDEEEDDLLEMPALSSFRGRKTFSPPQAVMRLDEHDESKSSDTTPKAGNSPLATPHRGGEVTKTSEVGGGPDEEEDFFEYEPDDDDEDGVSIPKRKPRQTVPTKYIQKDEDEHQSDEEAAITPNAQDGPDAGLYSTSPAIAIPREAAPASASPVHHVAASVGSYKGKPFMMSSVKNDEILEKAAEMGDLYSFVGSVRDGPEHSASYRADARIFDGTPRSLSERLMMEESAEGRRRQAPRNSGGQ